MRYKSGLVLAISVLCFVMTACGTKEAIGYYSLNFMLYFYIYQPLYSFNVWVINPCHFVLSYII